MAALENFQITGKTTQDLMNYISLPMDLSNNYTFSSPYPQQFPIPGHFVYYLIKNIKNPNVYLKLIQTCKYFFNQNPIIIARKFRNKKEGLFISHTDNKKIEIKKPNGLTVTEKIKRKYVINVDNIPYKIWLTENLEFNTHHHNNVSKLIQKVYYSNLKYLHLNGVTLEYSEYLKLTESKSIEVLTFLYTAVVVQNENKKAVVPFEKILMELPNIKNLAYCAPQNSGITNETAQKMLQQLPKFDKLVSFCLANIPISFDLKTFCEFVKNYKETTFRIYYPSSAPPETNNKIRKAVKDFVKLNKGYKFTIQLGGQTFNLFN